VPERLPVPPSAEFDDVARGAQFRDRIAIVVRAAPEHLFQALRQVTERDMKLAWLIGELRYLPSRFAGRMPAANPGQPFLATLVESGTLILVDASPREVITGSAAQLHRVHQGPRRFASRAAFDAFDAPDYDKLFMSVRVAPTGRPGESWLVLEHATRALSPAAQRQFAKYWCVIRPTGALVTWLLLRAIRRRAQGDRNRWSLRGWRSVRATRAERNRALPGDDTIPHPIDTLTHGITIRRSPRDIWPWLVQMGAGSRAGWYSYDALDNGRRRSAWRILPDLQHPAVGSIFPALPGRTDGFRLLALERERTLTLGWLTLAGSVDVTWTFVLDEVTPGVTRLVVRVRGGAGYRFHGLPLPLTTLVIRAVHFVMQRKQLIGIKRRAEAMLLTQENAA
jgi:hypothetical protein